MAPDERQSAPVVQGTGVEDTTITEGTVTFDIRFTAAVPSDYESSGSPDREKIGLILNVEAQNQFYPGYPLVKRGVYYCCRMISSQYGTVFTGSHYEKIKKVYSIWICTTPPKNREHTITSYALAENNFVGQVKEEQKNYDLLSVFMICLGNPEAEIGCGILKLLSVLFSSELKAEEKKKVLEEEFHIQMSQAFEEEVSNMCNLSEGVEQKGIQIGIQKGIQQALTESIKNLMDTMNMAAKEAMDALKIKEEDRSHYAELLKTQK